MSQWILRAVICPLALISCILRLFNVFKGSTFFVLLSDIHTDICQAKLASEHMLHFHISSSSSSSPMSRDDIATGIQAGDTFVPMHQRDGSWLPISRLETCCRCIRPQTPMLSCIIFTWHSSYLTFYNWWSLLRCRSRLCLQQASSRNQIWRRLKTHLFDCV